MKVLKDDNFLGGTLTIVSKPNSKMTIGRLIYYDSLIDEFIDFTTSTTCKDEDQFNTLTGIKIAKLKLAKQLYTYKRRKNALLLKKLNRNINNTTHQIKFLDDKLNHIKYELSKF